MADPTNKKTRPYISSRFVLELEGGKDKVIGTLQSIEGGTFKSEITDEKVGGSAFVTKYPGRPKFDDVTIQVGMAMAPQFWEWIKDSFTYNASRRSGALIALDYDNRVRWQRNFGGALIREVSFPTLDGAAKEPAYLTVKFAVESLEDKPPSMEKYPAEQQHKDEWEKQRLWLPSMFTYSIDGVTPSPIETCKIDGFTIKQEIIEAPAGGILENAKEPGRIDFPTLAVSILQRDAGPYMRWWDQIVRVAEHTTAQQKTGHIWFLPRESVGSGALQSRPLVTLDLYGVSLLGVGPVKHDSKQAQLQKVKLDLSVERIELKPGTGTV